MSAAEVIEQIKALPAPEMAKVVAFLHSVGAGAPQTDESVRTINPASFSKAKTAVFQKHDEVLRRLAQ